MNFTNQNRNVALAGLGGVLVGGVVAWMLLGGTTRIVLMHVPAGATVYVDNKVSVARADAGRVVLSGIDAGEHTLLVAGEKLWPWAKTVTLRDRETATFGVTALTTVTADLRVNQTPQFENAGESSRLREAMRTIPTKEDPLLSADGKMALWMEGDTIKASWRGRSGNRPEYFCTPECTDEITVLPSEVKIRSLSFYGGRNDVILFAAQNSIFALELDARGTQNFQPLYKGSSPIFSSGGREYCADACQSDYPLIIYDTGVATGNGFSILDLP